MIANDLPKRRSSLRYPDYDYSQPGGVFVTLCTYNRQRLFGEVADSDLVLSDPGDRIALTWQRDLPDRFPSVILDTFMLMPDHLQAILYFGTNPLIRPDAAPDLSEVIKWYKVKTQAIYSQYVRAGLWPRYERHLWQRNFHDRIIRNDLELERIRTYIEDNPRRWQERKDAMNVDRIP